MRIIVVENARSSENFENVKALMVRLGLAKDKIQTQRRVLMQIHGKFYQKKLSSLYLSH